MEYWNRLFWQKLSDNDPSDSLSNIAEIESSFSLLKLLGKGPRDFVTYMHSCYDKVLITPGNFSPFALNSLGSKYPWKLFGIQGTKTFLESFHSIRTEWGSLLRPEAWLFSLKYILHNHTILFGVAPRVFISMCFLSPQGCNELDLIISGYPTFVAIDGLYSGPKPAKILKFITYILNIQQSGGTIYPVELAYRLKTHNWTKIGFNSAHILEHRDLADSITEDRPDVLEIRGQFDLFNRFMEKTAVRVYRDS